MSGARLDLGEAALELDPLDERAHLVLRSIDRTSRAVRLTAGKLARHLAM